MKYDPRLCTFVVNGRQITMWLKLEGGREADRVSGFSTADGQSYVGLDPAVLGYYNLTLPTVNPHSGFFDNLANANDPVPVILTDRSDSNRSSRGSRCWIKKHAPHGRGAASEQHEEQWDFVVEDYTVGSAGAPEDDDTPMVTQ